MPPGSRSPSDSLSHPITRSMHTATTQGHQSTVATANTKHVSRQDADATGEVAMDTDDGDVVTKKSTSPGSASRGALSESNQGESLSPSALKADMPQLAASFASEPSSSRMIAPVCTSSGQPMPAPIIVGDAASKDASSSAEATAVTTDAAGSDDDESDDDENGTSTPYQKQDAAVAPAGDGTAASVPLPDGTDSRGLDFPPKKKSARVSCHQCKTTKDDGMLLFCTTKAEKGKRKRKCRKKYCDACLRRSYSMSISSLTPEQISTYTCPACRGTCSCAACQRKQLESIVRKDKSGGHSGSGTFAGLGRGGAAAANSAFLTAALNPLFNLNAIFTALAAPGNKEISPALALQALTAIQAATLTGAFNPSLLALAPFLQSIAAAAAAAGNTTAADNTATTASTTGTGTDTTASSSEGTATVVKEEDKDKKLSVSENSPTLVANMIPLKPATDTPCSTGTATPPALVHTSPSPSPPTPITSQLARSLEHMATTTPTPNPSPDTITPILPQVSPAPATIQMKAEAALSQPSSSSASPPVPSAAATQAQIEEKTRQLQELLHQRMSQDPNFLTSFGSTMERLGITCNFTPTPHGSDSTRRTIPTNTRILTPAEMASLNNPPEPTPHHTPSRSRQRPASYGWDEHDPMGSSQEAFRPDAEPLPLPAPSPARHTVRRTQAANQRKSTAAAARATHAANSTIPTPAFHQVQPDVVSFADIPYTSAPAPKPRSTSSSAERPPASRTARSSAGATTTAPRSYKRKSEASTPYDRPTPVRHLSAEAYEHESMPMHRPTHVRSRTRVEEDISMHIDQGDMHSMHGHGHSHSQGDISQSASSSNSFVMSKRVVMSPSDPNYHRYLMQQQSQQQHHSQSFAPSHSVSSGSSPSRRHAQHDPPISTQRRAPASRSNAHGSSAAGSAASRGVSGNARSRPASSRTYVEHDHVPMQIDNMHGRHPPAFNPSDEGRTVAAGMPYFTHESYAPNSSSAGSGALCTPPPPDYNSSMYLPPVPPASTSRTTHSHSRHVPSGTHSSTHTHSSHPSHPPPVPPLTLVPRAPTLAPPPPHYILGSPEPPPHTSTSTHTGLQRGASLLMASPSGGSSNVPLNTFMLSPPPVGTPSAFLAPSSGGSGSGDRDPHSTGSAPAGDRLVPPASFDWSSAMHAQGQTSLRPLSSPSGSPPLGRLNGTSSPLGYGVSSLHGSSLLSLLSPNPHHERSPGASSRTPPSNNLLPKFPPTSSPNALTLSPGVDGLPALPTAS